MRSSSSGVQIALRLALMSAARLRLKVVKRMDSPSANCCASQRARCMATTVLPVPAPPSTRTGPFQWRSTSRRWDECRNTRQRSKGAFSIASSSMSSSINTKRARRLRSVEGGGEIGSVHGVHRHLAVAQNLLVAIAGHVKEQPVVGFLRQAPLHGIQFRFGSNGTHFANHCFRHAQAEQLAVFQSGEDRNLVIRRGDRLCHHCFLLRRIHLQGTGLDVDATFVPHRPGVGFVVLVRPQEQMHVSRIRLEDNGAIAAVDAQRPHVAVFGACNLLVVEARGSGAPLELRDHPANALLLLQRQLCEGAQEVCRKRHAGIGHAATLPRQITSQSRSFGGRASRPPCAPQGTFPRRSRRSPASTSQKGAPCGAWRARRPPSEE